MPTIISGPGPHTIVVSPDAAPEDLIFIIDSNVTGAVNFQPLTGQGTAEFTVELNSDISGTASINFVGGSGAGQALAPTVKVAADVSASNVSFGTSGNIDSLDYNLGDDSSIGMLRGVTGTDANVIKTTVTGGDNVTIGGFDNNNNLLNPSKAIINLGDNATITGSVQADYGGLDLTAGVDFKYTAGMDMDFNYARGDCSVKLGANADTHGKSFSMGNTLPLDGPSPNYSVEVGDESRIGHIFMGGGYSDKTVILGNDVYTGDISIGGSGLPGDHMQIKLVAGNGTHIGGTSGMTGNIGLGGTFVDRTITFGDDVHVGGLLGMSGLPLVGELTGINNVTIGDRYTQDGYFTGSISGTDTIVIGNDWRFGSTFTLQGADDSLQIGYTTRDTAGGINGGLGTDSLTIIVPDSELEAFKAALATAGWTYNDDDGTVMPHPFNPLSWKGNTYREWEEALRVPCFTAGTLILTADGEVLIEEIGVGDLVQTRDNGLQPVRWIGSQKLGAAELAAMPKLRPIRIKAGALGPDAPRQDLLVSPQHRVLVCSNVAQKMFGTSEVLVAVKQFLQLDGFDIATDVGEVTYFHMLFDRHEVVVSNGAETESLHTGPEALKSVGKAAAEEIFALFPELAEPGYVPEPARYLPSGRQARKLGMRHLLNHHPLVTAGPL